MMYAAAGRDISAEPDAQVRVRKVREFRQRLSARADQDTFNAGFGNLRYSAADTKGRPLVAYVLKKVDRALRTTDAPVDYSRMTIEHIAPQNPADPEHLVDEYPSIGNLVLVGEDLNNRLRNRPFADKKAILMEAGVPMDEVLLGADEWGREQIQARAQLLADLVYAKA
jgi:hypothetical protein